MPACGFASPVPRLKITSLNYGVYTTFVPVLKTTDEVIAESLEKAKEFMNLNKDDTVCYAVVYSPIEKESSQALVYTTNGYGISIDLMEGITTTDRLTKGGQYLKLDDNDSIAGVCIVSDSVTDENIFVITKKGYGKVCGLDDIFKTS